jgi:hypothetical protein
MQTQCMYFSIPTQHSLTLWQNEKITKTSNTVTQTCVPKPLISGIQSQRSLWMGTAIDSKGCVTDWWLAELLLTNSSIYSFFIIFTNSYMVLWVEFLTTVKTSMVIFWVMAPCWLVHVYCYFRVTQCIHLQECLMKTTMDYISYKKGFET